jgi:transcriptional regulator with XRE-family HTH domain
VNSFGERLSFIMEVRNITYQDLAAATGLSRGNIGGYKKGDIKPSFDGIIALANFLSVSTDWLLLGRGPGPEELFLEQINHSPDVLIDVAAMHGKLLAIISDYCSDRDDGNRLD